MQSRLQVLRMITAVIFVAGLFVAFPSEASAQGFAGSNIDNYYCPDINNYRTPPRVVDENGRYTCFYSSTTGAPSITRDAVPYPPRLDVLQVWFVRLLYVLWSVSGIIFTGLLMWLGFKYLTSFGNEVALGEVVKDFRKWLIGLALIFLSYPVLNTMFNVLPISDSSCFEDISVPGFQFFFPQACRDIGVECSRLYPVGDPDYDICVQQGGTGGT